jgi:ADP-heptose:LPS heptosyltransferase
MMKALERLAKLLLALFGALFLWRPGRRGRATEQLARVRRLLLVRIDSRVGEALLTTPLVQALRQAKPEMEVDLLVHPRCAKLLEGCPGVHAVIPFRRRRVWLGALAPEIRTLRAANYDAVIDCANWTAPSVTSALISRLVAPRSPVVGPATGYLRVLRDVPVPPRADTRSEVRQRLHLLSPLLGTVPDAPMAFRPIAETIESPELQRATSTPFAVVNPGGRLGWRRVPSSVFATAARRLLAAGLHVLVTWGPGEETLAREVAQLAPGAEVAPSTSLDALAWTLARARLSVCNNTGPMHLSVAVGTPTLGLFLRMEMARWGHNEAPHRMIDLTPAVEEGGSPEAETEAAVEALLESIARG